MPTLPDIVAPLCLAAWMAWWPVPCVAARPGCIPPSVAAIPLQVLQDKEEYWYGFPAYDHKGMKIGKFNHLREAIDPNKQDKQVTAADV